MIELSEQLCEVLELTYWQLHEVDQPILDPSPTISRDEKDLLRKVLLAKGVTLSDEMIECMPDGVIIVHSLNYQLIFDDVNDTDQHNLVHLAKVSDMLNDPQQKKLTWYKLKNLDL